jgi:hypothetical protein
MPGEILQGKDAQLQRAIDYLMNAAPGSGTGLGPVPEYPDKSKPGESRGDT